MASNACTSLFVRNLQTGEANEIATAIRSGECCFKLIEWDYPEGKRLCFPLEIVAFNCFSFLRVQRRRFRDRRNEHGENDIKQDVGYWINIFQMLLTGNEKEKLILGSNEVEHNQTKIETFRNKKEAIYSSLVLLTTRWAEEEKFVPLQKLLLSALWITTSQLQLLENINEEKDNIFYQVLHLTIPCVIKSAITAVFESYEEVFASIPTISTLPLCHRVFTNPKRLKEEEVQEVLMYLISKGMSTEALNDQNETPIFKSIRQNHLFGFKFLINHINDDLLRAKNILGRTCLHEAILYNRVEMTRMILKRSEDILFLQDNEGCTPLFYFCLPSYFQSNYPITSNYTLQKVQSRDNNRDERDSTSMQITLDHNNNNNEVFVSSFSSMIANSSNISINSRNMSFEDSSQNEMLEICNELLQKFGYHALAPKNKFEQAPLHNPFNSLSFVKLLFSNGYQFSECCIPTVLTINNNNTNINNDNDEDNNNNNIDNNEVGNENERNRYSELEIASKFGCFKRVCVLVEYWSNSDMKKEGQLQRCNSPEYTLDEFADQNGNTVLHYCALSDEISLEIIPKLIGDLRCDFNRKNHNNRTAIHLAIDSDYVDVISKFLSSSLPLQILPTVDNEGEDDDHNIDYLIYSIKKNAPHCIHFFMQYYHTHFLDRFYQIIYPNSNDLRQSILFTSINKEGKNILFSSCEVGASDVVKFLLLLPRFMTDYSKFMERIEGTDNSSLSYDRAFNINEGFVSEDGLEEDGCILHTVCRRGDHHLLEWICDQFEISELNINSTLNYQRFSPLHFASSNGHLQCVSIILDRFRSEIDLNILSLDGETAIDVADLECGNLLRSFLRSKQPISDNNDNDNGDDGDRHGEEKKMNIIVFGGGFVGHRLIAVLAQRYPDSTIYETHRSSIEVSDNNNERKNIRIMQFKMDDEDTWPLKQRFDIAIITFPMTPIQQVESLYSKLLSNIQHVIVYGSTSRYIVTTPHQEVDETAEIDMSQARVVGEEFLRSKGALILVLSGIWGYERHPRNWYQKKLIRNTNKYLNLAHVDDITFITCRCIEKMLSFDGHHGEDDSELKGKQIIVGDGVKYFQADLAKMYGDTTAPHLEPDSASKILSNKMLLRVLNLHDYHFQSLN